jgi:hypothetical protein
VDAFFKTAQVDFENQVPQWRIGERVIQPHEIIVGAIQAGLIWRLDVDLAAHPLYSLIATVVCARMRAFSDLAQREWYRRVAQVEWLEFANAEVLERFLADLSEHEKKKQVRFLIPSTPIRFPIYRCFGTFSASRKDECV